MRTLEETAMSVHYGKLCLAVIFSILSYWPYLYAYLLPFYIPVELPIEALITPS